MTRQAIDRYEDGEPLFFNYLTEGALGAQQKLGGIARRTRRLLPDPATLCVFGDALDDSR